MSSDLNKTMGGGLTELAEKINTQKVLSAAVHTFLKNLFPSPPFKNNFYLDVR